MKFSTAALKAIYTQWQQRRAAETAPPSMLQAPADAAFASVVDPPEPEIKVPEQKEIEAVLAACEQAGLNRDLLQPNFDLAATGKLNDVIHYAAIKLGRTHPVRTCQDVVALMVRLRD